MKSTLLTFCFVLALVELNAQEQYMKSVVRITAQIEGIGEETGAGIIVGERRPSRLLNVNDHIYYVATARHVVAESKNISVEVYGHKTKYKAELIHRDEGMDVAVIQFVVPPPPSYLSKEALSFYPVFYLTEIIPPADPEIIVQGKKVQSIGHPGGGYWIPNLINVVQQRSLYGDTRFFSITPQAIVGGCSGGPVFLESGQWLGMITETGMVQAKCLMAETLANWLKTKGVHSNFITPPAFIPEMVRIEGHKKRASSFFITKGFDDEAEADDYYYDFSKDHSEVKSFSIGKYEITLREFEAFVVATGYISSAEKKGYSNGIKERDYGQIMVLQQMPKANWRHDEFGRLRSQNEYNCPVIHVSWEDADAYCKWLSKKTGKKFRLPTYFEWIYTFLPSKNQPTKDRGIFGNIMDVNREKKINSYMELPSHISTSYADGFAFIAPIGSFFSNEWGVHDLYGNVSEWCSDDFGYDTGKDVLQYRYQGPNWLLWYLDNKKQIVNNGYLNLYKADEYHAVGGGKEYADDIAVFDADESNCFLGFRVVSD